jgi:hypothetical protein
MIIEDNGGNELTITGNIKSIEDSMEIKKAINALKNRGAKSLLLRIRDSFSMTSTVIGHIMKLVEIDKYPVTMIAEDHRLYRLLEELSLTQLFKVSHGGK